MKKIKFGLKMWSKNLNLLKGAESLISDGVFQYVELMAIPGDDTSLFEKTKIPYILHIPHDSFGFNIGEKKSWVTSSKIMKQNIELANKLSAKYLILHPGFGQMKDAEDFLENVNDKRILIENMPAVGSSDGKTIENMVGSKPEQIKELMAGKFGFCLDFEHATKAAMNLETAPKKFIGEFMPLKPKVFHICDGRFVTGPDEHLNIGEGEYDFKFFLNCIKHNESQFVTLETARRNLNSLNEDLENLKKIKNFI